MARKPNDSDRRTPHWAALLCLWATPLATGCAGFSKGPTADHVVRARQLQLEATDAMQHGQWDEAEELFGQAITACPEDERAHSQYAETLWRRGASDQALEHMRTAVELSGGAPERRVQLGNMYVARGELNAAMRQAELALNSDAQLAGAWTLRGDVLERQGQDRDALACYHRCLAIQPHFPQAQISAARIYQQQQRHQRVLATLRTLEDGYPPGQVPRDVLIMQGIALKSMGRFDQAVERLSAAAAREAVTADLLYHLGEAQLLSGNATGARSVLADATRRFPDHQASRLLMGQIEERQRNLADLRAVR